MTHEQANEMIRAFFRSRGIDAPRIAQPGLIVADGHFTSVTFEYQQSAGLLKSRALVHRFNSPAEPELLEAIDEEHRRRPEAGGGGVPDYDPAGQRLYLSRVDDHPLPEAEFVQAINQLIEASQVWAFDILPACVTRVFHSGEVHEPIP